MEERAYYESGPRNGGIREGKSYELKKSRDYGLEEFSGLKRSRIESKNSQTVDERDLNSRSGRSSSLRPNLSSYRVGRSRNYEELPHNLEFELRKVKLYLIRAKGRE